ncbi:MAG: hypothetical protein M1819_002332 [Sarea resinae]|nr:MAG: hypothetical protein M1819_002332 [Sarea resinae]
MSTLHPYRIRFNRPPIFVRDFVSGRNQPSRQRLEREAIARRNGGFYRYGDLPPHSTLEYDDDDCHCIKVLHMFQEIDAEDWERVKEEMLYRARILARYDHTGYSPAEVMMEAYMTGDLVQLESPHYKYKIIYEVTGPGAPLIAYYCMLKEPTTRLMGISLDPHRDPMDCFLLAEPWPAYGHRRLAGHSLGDPRARNPLPDVQDWEVFSTLRGDQRRVYPLVVVGRPGQGRREIEEAFIARKPTLPRMGQLRLEAPPPAAAPGRGKPRIETPPAELVSRRRQIRIEAPPSARDDVFYQGKRSRCHRDDRYESRSKSPPHQRHRSLSPPLRRGLDKTQHHLPSPVPSPPNSPGAYIKDDYLADHDARGLPEYLVALKKHQQALETKQSSSSYPTLQPKPKPMTQSYANEQRYYSDDDGSDPGYRSSNDEWDDRHEESKGKGKGKSKGKAPASSHTSYPKDKKVSTYDDHDDGFPAYDPSAFDSSPSIAGPSTSSSKQKKSSYFPADIKFGDDGEDDFPEYDPAAFESRPSSTAALRARGGYGAGVPGQAETNPDTPPTEAPPSYDSLWK